MGIPAPTSSSAAWSLAMSSISFRGELRRGEWLFCSAGSLRFDDPVPLLWSSSGDIASSAEVTPPRSPDELPSSALVNRRLEELLPDLPRFFFFFREWW